MPSRLDANNAFSLYGLMNRARTAMGKRKLKVSPSQDLLQITQQHAPAAAATDSCYVLRAHAAGIAPQLSVRLQYISTWRPYICCYGALMQP